MIVTVANFKGGVGKTLVSLFVGADLRADIYSNDKQGIIHDIFDFYHHSDNLNGIKADKQNIVFDTGGFSDDISKVLTKSDLVIVPTLSDINSIKTTLDSIEEYINYNQNILVIETMQKGNDLIESALSDSFHNSDIPLFKLRYSKAFDNAILEGITVQEHINKDNRNKFIYRGVLDDMKIIHEAIKILGERR